MYFCISDFQRNTINFLPLDLSTEFRRFIYHHFSSFISIASEGKKVKVAIACFVFRADAVADLGGARAQEQFNNTKNRRAQHFDPCRGEPPTTKSLIRPRDVLLEAKQKGEYLGAAGSYRMSALTVRFKLHLKFVITHI